MYSRMYPKANHMRWSILLMPLLLLILTACSVPKVSSNSQPVQHDIWDELLQKYVDEYGLVDYEGFLADTNRLNQYLATLSESHPNDSNWSRNERYAYWVNAYNAFTIQLILQNYPIDGEGIKDIKNGIPFVNTVWDIKFIQIEDQTYDLNNIEHGILRQRFVDDPRFHFALVCASMSCPKLQRRAFTAERLDEQLEQASIEFFNEPFRNEINVAQAKLSKLLNWYWGDFKDLYGSRIELVNQYRKEPIPETTPTEFLDYDWRLNNQNDEKRELLKGK